MTDFVKKFGMVIPENCPVPTGYKVLLMPWGGFDKTAGGILIPDEAQEVARYSSLVCLVVSLGKDAFTGEKFANGPWFAVGDWVMIGRYAGNRFNIGKTEMRILNDDEIIAVLPNPEVVSRAY